MPEDRRNPDLDWLYRREPDPQPTRIQRPDEFTPLAADQQRRVDRGSYPPPPPPQAPPQAPPSTHRPPQPPPPPPPPYPSGQQGVPRPRPRRRRPLRRVIGALVLAWLLYLVAVPIYAWTSVSQIDATPSGERPADQPGTTVLLVGSDGRDQLTEEQRGELGTGDTDGRRTDTMILLHLPKKGEPAMISLPRDSWVKVPGKGEAKLNAAYAWGGAPLLVQTIEQNTGIRIDGYLEIGFLGVVEAVNAVGGIEVCPKEPIQDQDSHLDLPAGCQTLDGKTALGYVRMRKADPTGDLGRMARQREVIGKVAKKALHPLSVLNPVTYWKLNMAAGNTLGRGKDTSLGSAFGGVRVFLSAASGAGLSLSVPVADANARRDGQSVMLWDADASQEVFAAVIKGDSTPLEKYAK
ncbi:MAG: LCP family protein [Propionibacteriaceae bacterium]|nr:LCP family protein [Propionibacteriaceae bacterium]